ncbi:MAG: hypothetical protein ACK5LC_05890 [Coprobacillaceae bacterium]
MIKKIKILMVFNILLIFGCTRKTENNNITEIVSSWIESDEIKSGITIEKIYYANVNNISIADEQNNISEDFNDCYIIFINGIMSQNGETNFILVIDNNENILAQPSFTKINTTQNSIIYSNPSVYINDMKVNNYDDLENYESVDEKAINKIK